MSKIKTYRLFYESSKSFDRLKNIVDDLIQPLLDDLTDIKYTIVNSHKMDKMMIIFDMLTHENIHTHRRDLFNSENKDNIVNFFNEKKDLFDVLGISGSMIDSGSMVRYEFWLNGGIIDEAYRLSGVEYKNKMNELESLALDLIQPLLDDFPNIRIITKQRVGKSTTGNVSIKFYDDGSAKLRNNRREIVDFFDSKIDTMSSFGLEGDIYHDDRKGYDDEPIEMIFWFNKIIYR